MTLLSVNDLSISFGGLKAVNDVSFDVTKGTVKALIGPNGAGKTTLFNLISGFLQPDRGSIVLNNMPLEGLKPYQIARHGLSRTFQQIQLFPGMSALENVMIGRHMHCRSGFISGMFNMPWTRKEAKLIRSESLDIMEFLDIADHADTEASSLAYGQQRLVELARALACKPGILLLDEPAAGLNMKETAEMSSLIARIRESGITVLIVEHDMSLIMDISDEIVVLSYGEKIADDVPTAIQRDGEVIRVYLGDQDA